MKNEKILLFIIFFFVISSFQQAFAGSSYVLPYPSFMPGNKLYYIDLVLERIESYWSFGAFAQATYNLKLSDKYLVEAKTLFEYQQYPLALSALEKSNSYFSRVSTVLSNSKGKNIQSKENLFHEAGQKHIELLEKLQLELPSTFNWVPEKGEAKTLYISRALEEAIKIRRNSL